MDRLDTTLRPCTLAEAWPSIEPVARELMTDPDEHGPEDLRKACLAGDALCLRNDEGFVVVRIQVNPKTDHRELIVWWGHSVVQHRGVADRVWPELVKLANALNCVSVVYYSTRVGWLKKAHAQGFRVRNIEFARAVA